jgi:hypothetical protein
MTVTDEMVERAARALARRLHVYRRWDDLYKWEQDRLLGDARAALEAALRPVTS